MMNIRENFAAFLRKTATTIAGAELIFSNLVSPLIRHNLHSKLEYNTVSRLFLWHIKCTEYWKLQIDDTSTKNN